MNKISCFRPALLLLTLLLFTDLAVAGDWPVTRDLQRSAAEAKLAGEVLVVYVTMEGCPYCRKLEEDLLLAAYQRGELDDVHFVELAWDFEPIINFDGQTEVAADFLQRQGLVVTPTMLFPGAHGEELADRIIGYRSEDFYWQYFLEALAEAREWLD